MPPKNPGTLLSTAEAAETVLFTGPLSDFGPAMGTASPSPTTLSSYVSPETIGP